ncbi:MAG: ethylbenzene dehydrogenase-related protein [Candidatus Methylomirabilia bacterium]
MSARSRLLLYLLVSGLALGAATAWAQQTTLTVPFVEPMIPVDPRWGGWTVAPAVEITLGPQAIAKPWKLAPSIKQLTVKALHNGTWVAFLLTWRDATKNSVMYTDSFRDAVALMVPVGKAAAITMGAPNERVLILHWKADWQEDIDQTFQDVAQLYPNAWQDWYPFVVGEPPYDIREWTNPEAQRFLTGWVLGNPRSQPEKRTSIEEQIAEGFGTLTSNDRQSAVGKGVYANGGWQVVIARPLAAGDPNDPAWGPGKTVHVAFAAWDGGAGEIGSRKGISSWIAVTLGPVRP